MNSHQVKQKLETIACHIHGDAAHITVLENDRVEIETCCLLFRHQLLLLAGEEKRLVEDPMLNVA